MLNLRDDKRHGAEALLIELFRQAISRDPDAIDAMHTILDILDPPRAPGGLIFVIEE